MLTSQKNINKTYTGDYLVPWLGEGLLLSKGIVYILNSTTDTSGRFLRNIF